VKERKTPGTLPPQTRTSLAEIERAPDAPEVVEKRREEGAAISRMGGAAWDEVINEEGPTERPRTVGGAGKKKMWSGLRRKAPFRKRGWLWEV